MFLFLFYVAFFNQSQSRAWNPILPAKNKQFPFRRLDHEQDHKFDVSCEGLSSGSQITFILFKVAKVPVSVSFRLYHRTSAPSSLPPRDFLFLSSCSGFIELLSHSMGIARSQSEIFKSICFSANEEEQVQDVIEAVLPLF